MAIKMNFNDLPKGPEPIEEGIYLLKINDVILTETKTGKDAFVFEYQIVNKETKIKDYIMINNEDGTPHNFGRKKLRTLIEAAKIDIMDITPAALKQLSAGKMFKANVKNNSNDYPEINFDDFYSVDDTRYEALNTNTTEPAPSEEVKKAVEEVKPQDFMDDEDI